MSSSHIQIPIFHHDSTPTQTLLPKTKMITNIKRILGIGTPDPKRGNTIVVNAEKLERRVALLEEGILEEYSVEREGDQNIVGGIFKGRVNNI